MDHEPAARIRLKSVMKERGITGQQLSKTTGIFRTVISKTLHGSRSLGSRSRRVIEGVLGLAIWTKPEVFEIQQKITGWLGFDPYVITLTELRTRLSQRGLYRGAPFKFRSVADEYLCMLFLANQPEQFPQPIHTWTRKVTPATPTDPVILMGGAPSQKALRRASPTPPARRNPSAAVQSHPSASVPENPPANSSHQNAQ